MAAVKPTAFSLCLLFQWIANPLNDMYADAVTTVVLEVQSNPKAQKGQFGNQLRVFLSRSLVLECFMNCRKRTTNHLLNALCLVIVMNFVFMNSHGDPECHYGHGSLPIPTRSHVAVSDTPAKSTLTCLQRCVHGSVCLKSVHL